MSVDYDDGRFETRPREPQEPRPQGEVVQGEVVQATIVQEEVEPARKAGKSWRHGERSERAELARRRLGDGAYAIFRITVGAIMLAHGLAKLQDMPAWVEQVRGLGIPMPATLGLVALVAELGGGIALILGLFTRVAAALVFCNMLVAILAVHAGNGLFAKDGGYEYPLTLLMASLLFLAEGSRRYGIDASFWRAMRRRKDKTVSGAPRPHYAR